MSDDSTHRHSTSDKPSGQHIQGGRKRASGNRPQDIQAYRRIRLAQVQAAVAAKSGSKHGPPPPATVVPDPDDESGCSCHVNPPCPWCTSQCCGEHADDCQAPAYPCCDECPDQGD